MIFVNIDDNLSYTSLFSSEMDSTTNWCGDSNYNDAFRKIKVLFKHEEKSLKVIIRTNLTQNSTVASWGISQLSIAIEKCHVTCLTCSNPSSQDCKTCYKFAQLQTDNSCQCDPQYYFRTDLLECVHCHSDCFLCYGVSQTECLSCNDPR